MPSHRVHLQLTVPESCCAWQLPGTLYKAASHFNLNQMGTFTPTLTALSFFKVICERQMEEKHSDALLADPPSTHSFHSITRTLRGPGTIPLHNTRVTRQRPCSVELPFL